MLIAQLSDLHICKTDDTVFGGRDSAHSLLNCIKAVNALRPRADFAILSGDLANTGHPEEYIRLQSILMRLDAPYYLMPGNHDDHAALRKVFSAHGYLGASGPTHYSVAAPGLQVIALDTVMPGEEGGDLDAARLAWLEQTLAKSDNTPCIVFMHHPAFLTGIAGMDAGSVRNADAFWALLARYPRVKRVACGHVHRAMHTLQHGIPACIAPSTAAQLALQFDADTALQVTDEPAGFLLHATRGDNVLTHHVSVALP